MGTIATVPAALNTQQIIVKGVGLGLQLLPYFVSSIETLFGKGNGQTKKQAVANLFNASIFGVASGFGLANDSSTASLVASFQPLGNAAIDSVAAALYPSGTTVPAGSATATPVVG